MITNKKFKPEKYEVERFLKTSPDNLTGVNYIDWNAFRKEHEDSLLEDFEVYLPWGEQISLPNFLRFSRQEFFYDNPALLVEIGFHNLEIVTQDGPLQDVFYQFPPNQIRFLRN